MRDRGSIADQLIRGFGHSVTLYFGLVSPGLSTPEQSPAHPVERVESLGVDYRDNALQSWLSGDGAAQGRRLLIMGPMR